jgi:prepilin-type N-terminal cleavage/methylation domain-containing protein
MKKNDAFTLMELLIAIGIIALLAGLLIPLLSKSSEQSRKTYCANNLRQIGVELNAYANSCNGRLPVAVRVGEGPDDPLTIRSILALQNNNVYKCPSDKEKKYDSKTYFDRYGSSYEWNIWFNYRQIEKEKFDVSGNRLLSPLMSDAENFHGDLGKNHLYSDGRVSRNLENPVE